MTVGAVQRVAFSPDNHTLAVGTGRNLRLFDLKDADKALPVHDIEAVKGGDVVRSVAFSPDGRAIVAGSTGGIVKFWETATARETYASGVLGGSTFSVAFNPDGHRLAVVIGREVSIWTIR